MRSRVAFSLLGLLLALCAIGCSFNAQLLPDTLFSTGTPFVVKGTSTVLDNNGPCLAWIGENGITYHIFQTTTVDNATFDRITTPGVTSRLQLVTRSDLQVACQTGTIVEVLSVLEVVN
jgi:hypothetical protein